MSAEFRLRQVRCLSLTFLRNSPQAATQGNATQRQRVVFAVAVVTSLAANWKCQNGDVTAVNKARVSTAKPKQTAMPATWCERSAKTCFSWKRVCLHEQRWWERERDWLREHAAQCESALCCLCLRSRAAAVAVAASASASASAICAFGQVQVWWVSPLSLSLSLPCWDLLPTCVSIFYNLSTRRRSRSVLLRTSSCEVLVASPSSSSPCVSCLSLCCCCCLAHTASYVANIDRTPRSIALRHSQRAYVDALGGSLWLRLRILPHSASRSKPNNKSPHCARTQRCKTNLRENIVDFFAKSQTVFRSRVVR